MKVDNLPYNSSMLITTLNGKIVKSIGQMELQLMVTSYPGMVEIVMVDMYLLVFIYY